MRALGFGGGTDSTAILCGWQERGLQKIEPIDLILFADTGNEKPHTYDHIERMQKWLRRTDLPLITIVAKGGNDRTLEEDCLAKKMLPSIAYGKRGCSHKFKIEPQEKHLNSVRAARLAWRRGEKVEKLIGYDFSEERRWAKARLEDEKYVYRYPLVEWEWARPECVAAIERAGLPQPGKSACWFCPSSTKPEIDHLKRTYPLLFQRAIAMEDNAKKSLKTVKGLGRNFSWREYATTKEEVQVERCMACNDGGDICEVPQTLKDLL